MSESIDHLRDTFRATGRRWTSQRRLILGVLEESDIHLDAETLFVRAKARDSDISLATVYRTLGVLKEMGLVEEHSLGEEHAHFEAVRDQPHYHFVCLGCGRVIEFDAPQMAQIEQSVSKREGVCVTDIHLRLSGYCARCQETMGGQCGDQE
ncbi:MAG: transcriptional repressor [Anaerolineae bacterium]|nr:transcriptional repressor [Anaerolineae bacterium]